MVVTDFSEKYYLYENMAIWEISSMEDFFTSHNMMKEIFEEEYGFPYSREANKNINLIEAGFAIIEKLLNRFNDKHFIAFSADDENHAILKGLQNKKIISFGIDIYALNPKLIYVLEMDKTKDLKKYDV